MTTQSPAPQTLASVAAAVNGKVFGDGDLPVRAIVNPLDANGPEDLALAVEPKEFDLLVKSKARMAVVAGESKVPDQLTAFIAVSEPRGVIPILTQLFARPVHAWPGHHPTAVVDPNATIGANVSIGPHVYVGPGAAIGDGTVLMAQVTIGALAKIGKDCLFHSGARVGERVTIGDRAIVHMNAVIGADGFSYVTPEIGSVETAKATGEVDAFNFRIERINSIGTVVIGDDVEIGACTTIDRATIATTTIGSGTKIDNQVTIGHNNRIGRSCLIAGQVGIAGSCQIGNGVVMAGQVGVADHLNVGDGAILTAGAGVGRHVEAKAIMYGSPALPREQAGERHFNIQRLTRYYKQIDELERRLAALESARRTG